MKKLKADKADKDTITAAVYLLVIYDVCIALTAQHSAWDSTFVARQATASHTALIGVAASIGSGASQGQGRLQSRRWCPSGAREAGKRCRLQGLVRRSQTASQPTWNISVTSDLWRSLTQDKKKKKAEAPAAASAEVNFPRVRLLGMLPRVVSSDDRLRRPTLLSCLAG